MASAGKSFPADKVLSPQDIKEIIIVPAENGKEVLADKLGLGAYMDPKDRQKAPFISFLHDNIMFAAEKGFPLAHVALVVKFAHEFLKKILVKDHRLANAVTDFQEKSEIIAPLSDRHKKQYTDFIYQTVLLHYNLYKYVFSHLRDNVNPKVQKTVEVPPEILPMNKGKDIVIWEYNQKVETVETKEREAMKKNQERLIKTQQEEITTHKTMKDVMEEPTPFSKMTLSELVNDVVKGMTEKKEVELNIAADSAAEDLLYKFEKTAIARPNVLGPPKRFRPKSPVGLKTSNTNNSAKGLKGSKDRSPRSARSKSGRGSSTSAASKK